jgi:hypothetical protein
VPKIGAGNGGPTRKHERFSGTRLAFRSVGCRLAINPRTHRRGIADKPATGNMNVPNMEVERNDEHRD